MSTNHALRREIRQRRRALSSRQQARHAELAARHFISSHHFLNSRRIAAYLAADGELDPAPLLEQLRRASRKTYLPVIRSDHHNRLWFVEYRNDTRLVRNCFNILEPDIKQQPTTPLIAIDLILMPLVAFDQTGSRLGMGGGFYDRTLSQIKRIHRWTKPRLLGYAHSCQQVVKIDRASWDIPLDGIVTEQGLITPNKA